MKTTQMIVEKKNLCLFVTLLVVVVEIGILSIISDNTAYGQTTQSTQPIQFSNYAVVQVHQHLGDNKSDILSPTYPFRGDVSDTFTFTINNATFGQGYLLAQVFGSLSIGHTIILNGEEITATGGNFGLTGNNWGTLIATIDEGVLRQGQNAIQIQRNPNSTDNFLIDNVIINWHQQIPS